MRKINVVKPLKAIDETLMERLLRGAIRNVFHQIEFVAEAKAKDGPAMLVHVTTRTDFPPDADVACLICFRPDTQGVDPFSMGEDLRKMSSGCELWYWRDQFWVKGVDSLGVDYFTKTGDKKCCAFCPIEVANGDDLLGIIAD